MLAPGGGGVVEHRFTGNVFLTLTAVQSKALVSLPSPISSPLCSNTGHSVDAHNPSTR